MKEPAEHSHQPPDDVESNRGEELRSIDVWAHSAPIRLAGYEDDLAEPHILQGID
jgi:hypothetical protein